nr:hypothetical protein BaRGS_008125 [Batillaria attramentaria]
MVKVLTDRLADQEKQAETGQGHQMLDSSHRQKRGGGNLIPDRGRDKGVNETFEVKFHVVMSKQFKQLQRNNHRVFVCWKPEDKQFHNYMQEVTFTG